MIAFPFTLSENNEKFSNVARVFETWFDVYMFLAQPICLLVLEMDYNDSHTVLYYCFDMNIVFGATFISDEDFDFDL